MNDELDILINWAKNNQIGKTHFPRNKKELIKATYLVIESDSVRELPIEIGCLVNLRELRVYCKNLTHIPKFLLNCKKITRLYIFDSQLTILPSWIGEFKSLEDLILEDNSQLKTIPEDIGNLTHLSRLVIKGSHLLTELPKSIGNMNIKDLSLHCYSLIRLPNSISNLSLQTLNIRSESLEEFPNINTLNELYLSGDKNILNLIKWNNLTQLKKLALHLNLKEIPREIQYLNNLKTLLLDNNQISEVPVWLGKDLYNVSHLHLQNNNLKDLPNNLTHLYNIRLDNNPVGITTKIKLKIQYGNTVNYKF